MKGFPRVPESIRRVLIVFVVLAGGVPVVRMLIPPSMKDSAFHTQEATSREMARPVRHAGSGTCADCHDEYHVKETGYHASLSCETCHGAARRTQRTRWWKNRHCRGCANSVRGVTPMIRRGRQGFPRSILLFTIR